MLISIHIPKCAGTSFRTILHSRYRERAWDNYGRIFNRNQALPGIVPAGTECIHGHFLADAFDNLFPAADLITWLRHPVELVVSTYYHFLRHPDFRDDCCRALHERKLTLRQFADLEWMTNTAGRYLAGKPLEDFAFVGIVEHFGESLLRFQERFGQDLALPMPKNNVNLNRTLPASRISSEDFGYILARNAADYRCYEQARVNLAYVKKPNRPALPSQPKPFGLAGGCWSTSAGHPALV